MMKGVNNPLFLLPEDFSRALKENSLAIIVQNKFGISRK